jgi:hypothetical protein
MMMVRNVMTVFPLLVFFLAGGACGALFVAPRMYSHRGVFRSAEPQPERRWEDETDLLTVTPSVQPGGDGAERLGAAALAEAAEVYGPDAQLSVEAVGRLSVGPGSGKLYGTVVVRRLSPEGAAHDRA